MEAPHLRTSLRSVNVIEPLYTGGVVRLTPDEKQLVCTCGDEVKVVDLATGKVAMTFTGDGEPVLAIALSPMGDSFVASSRSLLLRQCSFAQPGAPLREFRAHDSPIVDLAYDPSGTLVAAGCTDGTVRVWDIERGYVTHNFREHSGVVANVRFHPDSSRLHLYSTADDCTIRVYDLYAKKCIAVLQNHVSAVSSLSFSLDGRVLLSAGRDRVVNAWRLDSHTLLKTLPLYETLEAVIAVPSTETKKKSKAAAAAAAAADAVATGSALMQGIRFITAGDKGRLRLWDLATDQCLVEEPAATKPFHYVDAVVCFTTGRVIAVTADHNLIIHEPLAFQREKLLVGFNDEVLDMRYITPTRLAVAANSEHLRLIDLRTGDCELLSEHSDIVLALDASPDGSFVATASKDMTVCIWRHVQERFVLVARLGGHTDGVGAVAFSRRHGHFVVTGSHDKTIKLWDLKFLLTGKADAAAIAARPAAKLAAVAHQKDINTVAVAPNDSLIATGSADRTVKIWSPTDFKLLATLRGHKRGVWHLDFSPVDKIIATCSADKTIKLWSLTDYSCLKTLEGHTGSVLRVFFMTAGLQLASTGADGLLKLWVAKTNECVATYDAHDHKAWALAVRPDHNQLATGGADGRLVVWDDVTLVERAEADERAKAMVEQEQELQNCLRDRSFKRAFALALQLAQPNRLLRVCTSLVDLPNLATAVDEMLDRGEVEQITDIVGKFTPETLLQVLGYIRDWNVNSRHSRTAHTLLGYIVRRFRPEVLLKLPNIRQMLDALIAYSTRHMARLDRLVQKSYLLDHTLQTMRLYTDELAAASSLPEKASADASAQAPAPVSAATTAAAAPEPSADDLEGNLALDDSDADGTAAAAAGSSSDTASESESGSSAVAAGPAPASAAVVGAKRKAAAEVAAAGKRAALAYERSVGGAADALEGNVAVSERFAAAGRRGGGGRGRARGRGRGARGRPK